MTETVSGDDARRLFLALQGFIGAPDRTGGVPGVLQRIGLVQLDTISVLARSHELVPYARLGAVGRPAVEAAYWGEPAAAFEYWGHAATVLPLEDWPWFAFRRRRYAAKYPDTDPKLSREIVARLRVEGPLTSTQLGGAKNGGPWWDWSKAKVSVERMLSAGLVICARRSGWRRVYDLPERVLPKELFGPEYDDATCVTELARRSAARLGIGTEADIADYHRLDRQQVRDAIEPAGLVAVNVAGWPTPAWADPAALQLLRQGIRGRHRTTLLSPFDSLVFDRQRTERMFGYGHRLEAYTPKHLRVHGYFTMPVLAGGRIVGRVDPAREKSTLVARQVSFETGAVTHVAAALREAATWVGATAVRVERLTPASARAELEAHLR
ncbi:MAG: crosslink repair DNA glycosylase YcaQ family protein [Mycobacteriales bacterium]